jgi:probable F420-dependent oxidoreductase
VLAAAAMVTQRARLGASVFILGHRHPVVMAKMLTTIDALSNGRLICGVGVGWWEEELTTLGAPFKQRGRHADEILKIFKTLFTEDHPTFKGEFFKFDDLGFQPKPVQKPHFPIWVGGNSPGAFRRVVTYGDGWHATYLQPDELAKSLDQLRAAADAAKRPFASIELSMRVRNTGKLSASRQEVIDLLGAYKKAGLTHVMLDIRSDDLTEMLENLDVVARDIRPAITKA